jgi:hypothetical protein
LVAILVFAVCVLVPGATLAVGVILEILMVVLEVIVTALLRALVALI